MTTPTLTDAALLREVFRYARSKGWRRDHDVLFPRAGDRYWVDDNNTCIEFDRNGWLDLGSVCNFEVITVGLAVDVLVAFGVLPTRFSSAHQCELVEQQRAEIRRLEAKLAHPIVRAVVDLVAEAERQYRRAEAAHVLKDEANERWLAAVLAPADATPEAEPTITCRNCGPVPNSVIYLLTWDSPHGDERCTRCGGGDLDIPHGPAQPAAPAAAGADQGEAQGGCVCGHPFDYHWNIWGGGVLAKGTDCQLCVHCNIYRAAPGAADDPTGGA